MKIRPPGDVYLEKAKQLTEEESDRLLSRIKGKLHRRLEDKKLSILEAVAIQLELEDLHLQEWRERIAEIRKKSKN